MSCAVRILLSCFLLQLAYAEGKGTEESTESTPGNPLARGWGDDITWVSFEDGLKIVKEQKRPMFLLIHKSWCPACQALKPKFTKAKQIVDLSKYFVMVNAQDDEEPWEEVYKPDGAYIPRILFLGKEGTVMTDMKNPSSNSGQYMYYYPTPTPIIKSMKEVLLKLEIVGKDVLDNIDDGSVKTAETSKQEL
uniref:Thioredoxin domain-containing protein n=1 Tax=Trichuris muris TaxID=70415 RepID=A0A5S6QAK2_TRIMR